MKESFIVLFIMFYQISFGQDFKTDFQKFVSSKDTINQKLTLEKWEMANSNDPELYTSYFNYYFLKARQEVIALTTSEPDRNGIELIDSTNKVAGFLGNQLYFDTVEINKGIVKIDKGIKLFPNRLDMRFGKIYVLGELEDWELFTIEIINTINYSKINENKWTWTNNEEQKDGREFLLTSIHDYQLQLYNTGIDDLLNNMRQIAQTILKYYPNHIESLSNLSISYILVGEYTKGLEPLMVAEKIDPKDYVVLANIAQCYKLQGNNSKAVEYYKKVNQYGDEQAKEYAKEQIKELKK